MRGYTMAERKSKSKVRELDLNDGFFGLLAKLNRRDLKSLVRLIKKMGVHEFCEEAHIDRDELEIALTFYSSKSLIRKSLADLRAGRTVSLETVFEKLEEKKK